MSGKDLKQSVTVNLEGNVDTKSQAYAAALERMARRGQKYVGGLGKTAMLAGRGLDKLGNRYTGLITGGAMALAVKQVGDLSMRYTRLGINANASAEQMDKLKEQVFQVSQAPEISVDPSEMIGAIEQIVEKTGDLKFAQDNIRNIGLAIQATGADGQSVGAMMAEFEKQGITAPRAVLKTLDELNQQGKMGAFTLKDIATMGSRVVTAYTGSGRNGVQAMKEMGAALQMIRMGTGSSEQATSAFEAVLRVLSDKQKIQQLKSLGDIQVFDPQKLKEGKEQLRPINELMIDIIKASKGKQTNLSTVFDAESMRAFNAAASEFKRTGTVSTMQKLMNVSGDGKTTMNDSARAAREFNSALTSLKTSWEEFSNNNLTGPVKDIASMLHNADKETVRLTLNTAKWGAAILGVAIAGRKAWKLGRAATSLFSGGKKGGAVGSLLKEAGGKPIPVYVVNGGGGFGGIGAGGKMGGRLAKAGKVAGTAGLAYSVYEIGHAVGSVINDTFIKGTEFQKELGGTLAHMLAMMGSKSAQKEVDYMDRRARGELHIKIDQDGRARVHRLKGQGMDVSVDVDAGQSMSMVP